MFFSLINSDNAKGKLFQSIFWEIYEFNNCLALKMILLVLLVCLLLSYVNVFFPFHERFQISEFRYDEIFIFKKWKFYKDFLFIK